MILSDALILPVSQLETQVIMSQIRSHIEYLILIFLCSCYSQIYEKNCLNDGF